MPVNRRRSWQAIYIFRFVAERKKVSCENGPKIDLEFRLARLVQSSAGKLSSISLPDRAKKQLIYDENTLLIGILLLGELSAVDISDFAPPGESYVAFQNDAIADSQMIFNARNLEFE